MDEVDINHTRKVGDGSFSPKLGGDNDQAVGHKEAANAGQPNNHDYAKHISGSSSKRLRYSRST